MLAYCADLWTGECVPSEVMPLKRALVVTRAWTLLDAVPDYPVYLVDGGPKDGIRFGLD